VDEGLISTAAVDLRAPNPQHHGIVPVPLGKLSDEQCYTVAQQRVNELGDGSVYLDYVDRYFGELSIVFGSDLRDIARIVSGETDWKFCFDVFIMWDEFGEAQPVIRSMYFVPPDLSG
jgi:hypothetical protein